MVTHSMSKRVFVEEWWRQRIVAGSQLQGMQDEFAPPEHRGPGPWYRTVSINALYRDFLLFMHQEYPRFAKTMSTTGFMMILRALLPEDTETVYIRLQGGRKRCLRFEDLAFYESRQHSWEGAWL